MRPAGANDFLRWRRTIDEHLECRRLSWDEYGMFNWLCTKASPRTGTVRTSWPILAEQTGLSANHVEKLCRSLKQKRYVWYPLHRGRRVGLVEVAIHKYPIAGDTYTDLTARFAEPPTGGDAGGLPGGVRGGHPGGGDLRNTRGRGDLRARKTKTKRENQT